MMDDVRFRSAFAFAGYTVERISFERNADCTQHRLKLDYDIDAGEPEIEEKEDSYEGTLKLLATVFPSSQKQNYPFSLHVELKGYFAATASEKMTRKFFEQCLQKNGIAILYPYLRAMVTDASRMANVTPVILPTMNVALYLKEKQKKSSCDE
jgi:preprotein translocase subunit SecB